MFAQIFANCGIAIPVRIALLIELSPYFNKVPEFYETFQFLKEKDFKLLVVNRNNVKEDEMNLLRLGEMVRFIFLSPKTLIRQL